MKKIMVTACFFQLTQGYAQIPRLRGSQVYRETWLTRKPVFTFGVDSCQRYYYYHCDGLDTLLQLLQARGDTAKYIRLYFSFVIDHRGILSDPRFVRVGATAYAGTKFSRTLTYFSSHRHFFQKIIEHMLLLMPFWKPGLLNGIPVDARVEDYIQFWVGKQLPITNKRTR